MIKYCLKKFPIKILDEKIINVQASLVIGYEINRRIIFIQCDAINYVELPETCILEVENLKKKFRLSHVDAITSPSDVYKIKLLFMRAEDIAEEDEWSDIIEKYGYIQQVPCENE